MAVSRAKKNKTPARRRKPLNEKHIIGFLFSVCVVLTVFIGGLLIVLDQLKIPDISSVSHYRPLQSTLIFDSRGNIVDRVYEENRIVVPLDRMHPLLPKAFVAAEDSRFYEHPGLDSYSVLRALINNLRTGRKSQGGSTITQQVAKGLLLSPEKTYLRKFKEAILARKIDSLLSKDDIIYIYLNQIYLGEGAHGVEAASMTYFGKRASELDLGEIAILAGLPQAPSRYSPIKNLEKARARQRYVLNRMAADGYITDEQARNAYMRTPEINRARPGTHPYNGYYLEEVRKRAEQMLGVSLKRAGVRIYTNLDQTLQYQAQKAVQSGVDAVYLRQKKKGRNIGRPEGALVCIDGCGGRVRALTGGTDYLRTPFNRAVQARRPAGSVFKPLVYAAAFEQGWNSGSEVVDQPLSIRGSGGKPWEPKNFSGVYHGRTTVGTALIHSYNIPAVKVLGRVGLQPVHRLAKEAGISSDLPSDLSLALGAVDVSLLEMSAAYLPFVCNGQYRQPTLIQKIENSDGKEIYRNGGGGSRQALSPASADAIKGLLVRVVAEGTGKKAGGLSGVSGGKTGTSDESRDAWFIGFHRDRITGVWIGHDRNQSLGENENGGTTAAPVWLHFMKEAGR